MNEWEEGRGGVHERGRGSTGSELEVAQVRSGMQGDGQLWELSR